MEAPSPAIKPWILAARPKTLGAAVAPVLVGSALGWKLGGQFCIWLALAALGSCVCLQVATNLFNDALDSLKGGDTKERLGPVRITASGMMPAGTVLKVAAAVLALAALLAVPLFIYRGWPIVAIGIPSLWFCFGYTGGPWPLAYRGLGELFVILFFGLVAVTGSAFVQGGHWHLEAVIAGLQIGLLSTVLIAINNLRDVEEDARTGKRTLAVRLGKRFARREIHALYGLAFAFGLYWFLAKDWVLAGILPLVAALPVVMILEKIVRDEPSRAYNNILAFAGVALVLFSVLLTIGICLGPL